VKFCSEDSVLSCSGRQYFLDSLDKLRVAKNIAQAGFILHDWIEIFDWPTGYIRS
jgi:hypothetical protein